MPAVFDAQSTAYATTSTYDISWTHTPVGTPTGVIVYGHNPGGVISGATYGGVALTLVGFQNDLYCFKSTATPAPGAQTVVVTSTGYPSSAFPNFGGVVSVTGGDPTDSVSAFAVASYSDVGGSVAITVPAGELGICCASGRKGGDTLSRNDSSIPTWELLVGTSNCNFSGSWISGPANSFAFVSDVSTSSVQLLAVSMASAPPDPTSPPALRGSSWRTNVASGNPPDTIIGQAVGDLIYGHAQCNSNAFTEAPGWTPLNNSQDAATGEFQYLAYRIADGSANDAFRPTYPGTSVALFTWSFVGCDAVTPHEQFGLTQWAGTSATVFPPNATPTRSNSIHVVCYAESSNSHGVSTPPSGYTQILVQPGGGARFAAYYKTLTGQEGVAQGPINLTWFGVGYGPAWTAVVRAQAEAGGVGATPGNAALGFAGLAPTVLLSTGAVAQPEPAALGFTGLAPIVNPFIPVVVSPGAAALALTGHAPTVTAETTATAQPGRAALSFTGLAPTITRTVGGGVGSLPHIFGLKVSRLQLRELDEQFSAATTLALPHDFSVKNRIVMRELDEQFAAAMGPSLGTLPHTFATKTTPVELNDLDEQFAALLSFTTGATTNPAPAQIQFSGLAPNVAITVSGSQVAFPARASISFIGRTPTVAVSSAVIGPAVLAFTGRAPTVVRNTVVTPGRAILAFTGRAPNASGSFAALPGRAALAFSGQAPNVVVSGSASAITSAVLASRVGGLGIEGVAPLYVHFDAMGTTSSNSAITSLANGGTYRQVTHAFNFGDPSAGTYTQTGRSRNTHTGGPITAHVYESPGTYQVNVTHSHAGTNTRASTPITITVSDPNTVYTGSLTICINGTGSNDGLGPSGCLYQATVGTPISGRRYLFRRGGTYDMPGGAWNNVYVGAYGAGAKPVISAGGITNLGTIGNNRIVDCAVRGRLAFARGQHNLAARCDMTQSVGSFMTGTQEDGLYASRYVCLFESTTDDPAGISSMGFYGNGPWLAMLGCRIGRHSQHGVRLPHSYKCAIQNNSLTALLSGAPYPGTALKMHAQGTGSSPVLWDEVSAGTFATSYNCVSNNIFGDPSMIISWTCAVDPQNNTGTQVEGLTDIIIENNQFYRGTGGSPKDIVMGGRRITYRGNTSINATMLTDTSKNPLNIPPGWDGPYFAS